MKADLWQQFLSLPIDRREEWQGGIATLTGGNDEQESFADTGIRLIVWRSKRTGLMNAQPYLPSVRLSLDEFLQVMLGFVEMHECRHRPAVIACNDRDLTDALVEILADSGTSARFEPNLRDWNALVEQITEELGCAPPPIESLIEAGCSERQIEAFAEAAGAFYQAGLWDHLSDVDLIQVESPAAPPRLKYCIVLGAGDAVYGLAFYRSANAHRQMMTQSVDPRRIESCGLWFGTPSEAMPGDVALWKALDLPLAADDAFPSFLIIVDETIQRPTPAEVDTATAILRALAETREDEIDAGRWTKRVTASGQPVDCVLSIPDLINPPDRAEWLRRGLRPDRRCMEHAMRQAQAFVHEHADSKSMEELNEEINRRFVGPFDPGKMPRETPRQISEALYQEALDSYGRRRIQLAKQALAADPTHVDPVILLAESTRSADRRIALYQSAVESARAQLGDLMHTEVGRFWGLIETRPFMRACEGLAEALVNDGRLSEAIDQCREMLRLNPGDNQGVRYQLFPLLIACDRDSQARELLAEYREDGALWHYMNAIVMFRLLGPVPAAKAALDSAFAANEEVVPLLASLEPPMRADHYSAGSVEEAAVCLDLLSLAWAETECYCEWMMEQFQIWRKGRLKLKRKRAHKLRAKAVGNRRTAATSRKRGR